MTTSTPTETEADVLDGGLNTEVTLQSGFIVRVERVKMRQLMRASKVLLRGAGDVLDTVDLDNPETLIPVILQAFGEAENETIALIQSLVVPADHIDFPRSAADRAKNEKGIQRLVQELTNPEIEDTINIVEIVVKQERPYFESLGKRLSAVFTLENKATKE